MTGDRSAGKRETTGAAPDLAGVRARPNALAVHYTRFRVADRLLLSGHSHQAWPDVAVEGHLEAFADAAACVDGKWARAAAKAGEVAEGFRALLDDRCGEIALGVNTHELVVRFLSALDLRRRRRVVTTDEEFHTVRRQLDRLTEEGLQVVRVPVEPVGTLAERLAAQLDDSTAAVLVSAVLYETARIVPHLDQLAEACAASPAELLVDAYHALGAWPMPLGELGLGDAWVTGGGYKYLQLGEGNCFLRIPEHAHAARPAITGWFAESADPGAGHAAGHVDYAPGAGAFAGATYDPVSHYRAARVFRFHAEHGLTPSFLRAVSRHQVGLLAERFDELDLPPTLAERDRSLSPEDRAGFLALRTPAAARTCAALAERGVSSDSRGPYLRLGPAPYLADEQLHAAMDILGEVLTS